MRRVDIWSEQSGAFLRLRVEDSGIGIEPTFHGRLAPVFQRLHGVGSLPGAGLEPAIARRSEPAIGGNPTWKRKSAKAADTGSICQGICEV